MAGTGYIVGCLCCSINFRGGYSDGGQHNLLGGGGEYC